MNNLIFNPGSELVARKVTPRLFERIGDYKGEPEKGQPPQYTVGMIHFTEMPHVFAVGEETEPQEKDGWRKECLGEYSHYNKSNLFVVHHSDTTWRAPKYSNQYFATWSLLKVFMEKSCTSK